MPRIRKLRVVSVAVPVALFVVASTAWADPLLAESMGLDVWEIGRLENDLKQANHETARLETALQDTQEIMVLNEMILRDVIDGRVELPAAAKRKWEANKYRKIIREHLDMNRTGANYEEKTAHDLYLRAIHESQKRADHDALCQRLRAEYQAAYHTLPELRN
ncbi:hypothetical protein [Limnoglobus roseus]|uniref:Uncharacterized protein n=1 Tax=Limnoglobus roseus TaxID=2598579 RepID=A0A5C1A7T7_9BACT|nr:hypothetical protein [Limnoglobus roseus]QEL14297.1 hypothetical protein PX52LOC_01169 [Limnoglobus roseus]